MCRGDVDRGEHRTVYALGKHPTSEPGVHIHEAHQHFSDNVVITSKVLINIVVHFHSLALEPGYEFQSVSYGTS